MVAQLSGIGFSQNPQQWIWTCPTLWYKKSVSKIVQECTHAVMSHEWIHVNTGPGQFMLSDTPTSTSAAWCKNNLTISLSPSAAIVFRIFFNEGGQRSKDLRIFCQWSAHWPPFAFGVSRTDGAPWQLLPEKLRHMQPSCDSKIRFAQNYHLFGLRNFYLIVLAVGSSAVPVVKVLFWVLCCLDLSPSS